MLEVQQFGSGEDVVALPCTPVPVRSLGDVVEALSEERRVVVPEFTGMNLTPREALPHLVETLRRKRVEGAPVIGHSVGAFHAFQLAISEDFRVGPICAIGPLALQPAERMEMFRRIAKQIHEVEDAVPYAVDMWFSEGYRAEHAPEELVAEWFAEVGFEAVVSALRVEMDCPDLRPQLSDVEVPVRLVVGDGDVAAPVDWAEEIHERLPTSELHVVDGAGHFPQIEAPRTTVDLVRDFL